MKNVYKVLAILVLVVIIVGGVFYYFNAGYAGWQTYTSTKYSYSFHYPQDASLVTYGEAGKVIPTTPTSYAVTVTGQNNTALFDVRDYGGIKLILDKEQVYKIILQDSSTSEKARASFAVSPITIGGVSGFKVVSSTTGHTSYYVKRSPTDSIVDVDILTDNAVTRKILSSLKFY